MDPTSNANLFDSDQSEEFVDTQRKEGRGSLLSLYLVILRFYWSLCTTFLYDHYSLVSK